MIAVDTNVLVYAHRRDSEFHAKAKEAVRGLAEGRAAWAIPWSCVHEFLAVVTHPRIYDPPSSPKQGLEQVDTWLESPSVVLLSEAPDHSARLRQMILAAAAAGGRIHDARVAAICSSHGVTALWSVDRDFSRYQDLRVINPLA